MVRAKFVVQEIVRRPHWDKSKEGEIHTVKMSPVTGGSEEDKAFWAATPGGSLEMGMVNGNVAANFELGKAYYIDFTPAE